MSKIITIELEIEDDEFKEFMSREDVQGNFGEWVFGEICQNHGLGFMTSFSIVDSK